MCLILVFVVWRMCMQNASSSVQSSGQAYNTTFTLDTVTPQGFFTATGWSGELQEGLHIEPVVTRSAAAATLAPVADTSVEDDMIPIRLLVEC